MNSSRISETISDMEWIDSFAVPSQDLMEEIGQGIERTVPKLGKLGRSGFIARLVLPTLTYLPVVAWSLAAVFDIFSGHSAIARADARVCVLIGVVAGLPSIVAGSAQWVPFAATSIRRIGGLNALLCFAAWCFFAASLGFRTLHEWTPALLTAWFGLFVIAGATALGRLLAIERPIRSTTPVRTAVSAQEPEFLVQIRGS